MRSGSWLVAVEGVVHGWLVRHSIPLLRVSMGLVFFGFGILKYFPGVSPAQDLAIRTTRLLTFGLIPATPALMFIATLECVIGLSLISGKGLRVVIYLLVVELVGILSPLALLPGRLFSGPFHAPTLEGQYVLKDVILVTAAMVVATQFRGARIAPAEQIESGGDAVPRHRRARSNAEESE